MKKIKVYFYICDTCGESNNEKSQITKCTQCRREVCEYCKKSISKGGIEKVICSCCDYNNKIERRQTHIWF